MDNKIQVLDGLLNDSANEQILFHLDDSANFNWFFFPNVYFPIEPTSIYESGFRHLLCKKNKETSEYFFMIQPIILQIEQSLNKKLVQTINAHANLNLNLGKPFEGVPHIDGDLDCETETSKRYTAIYYVEDSDGDTILYDNEIKEIFRCSPKKNRCLVFESNVLHSGSLPTQHNLRRVININLLLEDK